MKEIVIVSKGNNAVAYGAGVEIKKSSTTGVSANLAVLNEVLSILVHPGAILLKTAFNNRFVFN